MKYTIYLCAKMIWLLPFAPFLLRQLEALKSQQQGVPYWMLAIDRMKLL